MSAAAVERDVTTAYQQPVDGLLAVLGTDARRGLGGAEARAQAEQFAADVLEELRAGLGDNGVTLSAVVDDGPPKQMTVRVAYNLFPQNRATTPGLRSTGSSRVRPWAG